MAIFLDLLGILKSQIWSLYILSFFIALQHAAVLSISMQHMTFVPLSGASSWREWATLCYFTMAELLIHRKREVCEQFFLRGRYPTNSLIIHEMSIFYHNFVVVHPIPLILVPKHSLFEGLSNNMFHECF